MNNIEHLIVSRQPVVYTTPRPTVVYGGTPVVYTQPHLVHTTSNSNIGLFIFFFIIFFILIIFFFTPVIYV
jgi:hypothetical protein